MPQTLTLVPAYGRKYATQSAMESDWAAGKDFKIFGSSTYVNRDDVKVVRADANDEAKILYVVIE